MVNIKLIERDNYLEQLEHTKNTPDIKVITGVRRSGKSKLLEMFAKKIESVENNVNIIHVDFNLLKFEPLLEYHKLHDFIKDSYQEGKDNYVIIDEIQMCENFEKAVNSLHASEKIQHLCHWLQRFSVKQRFGDFVYRENFRVETLSIFI